MHRKTLPQHLNMALTTVVAVHSGENGNEMIRVFELLK